MINQLFTSEIRIKLLLKFFLNNETKSSWKSLKKEFGDSSDELHAELKNMELEGLLCTSAECSKKKYFANTSHELYIEINDRLKKRMGIDQIINKVTSQISDLQAAYLTDDCAMGIDSQIIDLSLVGNQLDRVSILSLVKNAENFICRRINYIILSSEEMTQCYQHKPVLQIWQTNLN